MSAEQPLPFAAHFKSFRSDAQAMADAYKQRDDAVSRWRKSEKMRNTLIINDAHQLAAKEVRGRMLKARRDESDINASLTKAMEKKAEIQARIELDMRELLSLVLESSSLFVPTNGPERSQSQIEASVRKRKDSQQKSMEEISALKVDLQNAVRKVADLNAFQKSLNDGATAYFETLDPIVRDHIEHSEQAILKKEDRQDLAKYFEELTKKPGMYEKEVAATLERAGTIGSHVKGGAVPLTSIGTFNMDDMQIDNEDDDDDEVPILSGGVQQ